MRLVGCRCPTVARATRGCAALLAVASAPVQAAALHPLPLKNPVAAIDPMTDGEGRTERNTGGDGIFYEFFSVSLASQLTLHVMLIL